MNRFLQTMPSAYMPMQQAYRPYRQPYRQMPTRMVPQISGRAVNPLDDITVQEVPTDGTVASFPSADGKCIYGKRWTPDGNILTCTRRSTTPSPPRSAACMRRHNYYLSNSVKHLSHS